MDATTIFGDLVDIQQEPTPNRFAAEWGGYRWTADTRERLSKRLEHLDPFVGMDTTWGDPGDVVGELDQRIRADVRKRMLLYDAARREAEDRLRRIATSPDLSQLD